ncbi:phosphoribosylanthranilate isomerase [Leptospira adleri]|uniref:N-(5'-phosphoribosyl)anthranilate isomerase n=1 Tax=Leptospira adleri TaxID=2023186 RepID=A0A2M9YU43_9LEPT|nr:phosphoribosylanthranilate isomerase [Leptospira adleri]PJZ55044.1 N-(5'-phosphoribosyl)anthranilate isomerase [Leptospira adleri]PJZ63746.1 N-(5'-phosphoribosyl)anthranilate isomerase [Leptospira adleri]
MKPNFIPKTRVKICGIRDLEIAKICKEEGADFIGLNFAPSSPRKIDIANARNIVQFYQNQNDSPKVVLLFYKNSPEDIRTIRNSVPHDYVQWVWDDPEIDSSNRNEILGQNQICSYRVSEPIEDDDLKNIPGEFLILDSYSKGAGGGTGESFNWDFVYRIKRKFLLAGGLNPENVASAIAKVKPFGVDVASGVESSPGQKDAQKVIDFIRNTKSVS